MKVPEHSGQCSQRGPSPDHGSATLAQPGTSLSSGQGPYLLFSISTYIALSTFLGFVSKVIFYDCISTLQVIYSSTQVSISELSPPVNGNCFQTVG